MIPTCLSRYFYQSFHWIRPNLIPINYHDGQGTPMFRQFYHITRIALASSAFLLLPTRALGYQYIEPQQFVKEESGKILRTLGADDALLDINARVSHQMIRIIQSPMVQGMAKGTLTRDVWEKKYMKPDVLYIYRLGQALAERAKNEKVEDQLYVSEMATMFLGYGKHFERLKKYGLQANDQLVSPKCDQHIAFLSQQTSIDEFYIAILTDMAPYVIFANYLLRSIEPADNNPWIEYATKYGDLNNKYAKGKLGNIIQVANTVLATHKVNREKATQLFEKGFSFEEWFIRRAFSKGFQIVSANDRNIE